MEPSIKEVGKLEGEGSKFVEIYLLLEIKICCRHGGWGYFSLNYQRLLWTVHILDIQKNCTGCNSIFRKIFEFKICKDPMLVVKQMRPQQIALDLSFNLAPWKWAWHYQEAATPPRREKHRCARRVFDFLPSMRVWQPHDNATPTFRVPN